MWLDIDKNSEMPLIRQIYEQVKLMILKGKLSAGEKLPSTRWLSENLKISRNVVLEAYAQLMAEGYVEGKRGSGTIVAKGIYFKKDEIKVQDHSNNFEHKDANKDLN